MRDRSIANAITPLWLTLDAAVAEGLLNVNPFEAVLLPRRRAGRAWERKERRFLTREELAREGGPSESRGTSSPGARAGSRRAGLSGVGFHTLRHTCASLLIESGLNVLRLQRWMGHHSPAFTLEVYGHLLDGGDLGPPLNLSVEIHASIRPTSASEREAGIARPDIRRPAWLTS